MIMIKQIPPYWCSYGILNGTDDYPNITAARGDGGTSHNFYGYHFDINKYEDYINLLDDNLCKEWTDLDDSVDGINASGTKFRKSYLAQYLSPFYLWISLPISNRY